MARYRKKPVVIEAFEWLGPGTSSVVDSPPTGCLRSSDIRCEHCGNAAGKHGEIATLENKHDIVCPGDWIIKGIKGEIYACKPDVFAATYEKAE